MSLMNSASTTTIREPSIKQLRVILIIFLSTIIVVIWWQNTAGTTSYSVQKISTTPIAKNAAELDLTTAEGAWSGLEFDLDGNLEINARTEASLVDTIPLIEGKSSEPKMARIGLLLEKQFGANASQQIIALIQTLKDYKEAEQHWWKENINTIPPAHTELFQLQDEFFGKTQAKKMFSQQRRYRIMMLASYQIKNNTNLTQAEKDQQLIALHKAFQEGMLGE